MNVDFGPDAGGKRTFPNRADFDAYVQTTIVAWERFFDEEKHIAGTGFQSLVRQTWDTILQRSQNSFGSQYDSQVVGFAEQEALNKSLVSSESEEGQKFKTIFRSHGQEACIGAFQMRSGQMPTFSSPGMFQGVLIYSLMSSGMLPKEVEVFTTEVDTKLSNFEQQIRSNTDFLHSMQNQMLEGFRVRVAQFDVDSESRSAEYRAFLDEAKGNSNAKYDEFRLLVEGSQSEWTNLRNAYNEQLAIEAPIKYWKDKAIAHKKSYDIRKWLPVGWGIVGTALIVFGIFFSFHGTNELLMQFSETMRTSNKAFAISSSDWLKYVAITVGATTLFMTTLCIWGIRFFLRIALTDHHLNIDAEARAVMAETYLALTKVGKTEESERVVILSALFRPVTDGLVRDDALPSISPATLLTNLNPVTRSAQ